MPLCNIRKLIVKREKKVIIFNVCIFSLSPGMFHCGSYMSPHHLSFSYYIQVSICLAKILECLVTFTETLLLLLLI